MGFVLLSAFEFYFYYLLCVDDCFALELVDFFDCEVLLWGAGVACFIPFLCKFILINEKGRVKLCDFD